MRTPGIYRARLVDLRQRWLRFDAAARLHGAEPRLSGDRCGGVFFFFHSSYSATVLFCVLLIFVFPVCFLCFACHYVFNFFLFLIVSRKIGLENVRSAFSRLGSYIGTT